MMMDVKFTDAITMAVMIKNFNTVVNIININD